MPIDLNGITTADEFFTKLEINLDDVPPVDVVNICRKLEISIEVADMSKYENEYGSGISGALVSTPDVTTILVNNTESPVRHRFTIAHELAHYVLHRDHNSPRESFISFRGAWSNPEERAANRFAANLLMPEKVLRKHHAEKILPLLWTLAEEFNVSQATMRYQLDSLGLRYYAA